MKPKVKRVLKIVTPIIATTIVVSGVIVLSSGFIHNVTTVSIGGSTAVLPLINEISNQLKYIDIVTSAGGSGVGINSIIQNTKEIGMASKNPLIIEKWKENPMKESVLNNYNTWKNHNIKTLTIAWDGIGIIYKPSKNSSDKVIDINPDTLGKIYSAFSGYQNNITFDDLLKNGDKTIITPYARNGGGEVSGTTEAFLLDSNIDWQTNFNPNNGEDKDKVIETITNNIQKGQYGKHVRQTSEANSQAWQNVKNGPEGSMIYLSSGYIINNKSNIEKHGFKIATYNGQEMTIDKISSGYNWFRPFNLIYSMNYVKNKPQIIQFFEDIIFDHKTIHPLMESNGYKPLSNEQIESMFKENITESNKKELFTNEINNDISLDHSGAKYKIPKVK